MMDRAKKRQALGEHVRQARREAGLTQNQLAERAQIDQGYLARIERGLKWPSLETLYRLAEAVGLPASSFLEDTCLITGDDVCRKAVQAALAECEEDQLRFLLKLIVASARALASTLRVIRTSPAYATPRTKKTGSRRGHIALAKDIARPAPRFLSPARFARRAAGRASRNKAARHCGVRPGAQVVRGRLTVATRAGGGGGDPSGPIVPQAPARNLCGNR